MINRLSFTFTILFCLIVTIGLSQKKRVIGFDEDDENEEVEEYVYKSAAIKVAPFNFLNGNFPVFFEKEMSNFGIQVGAGPTFKRYFDIYSEVNHSANLTASSNLDQGVFNNSYTFDIDNTTANIGLYATLEGKYYYSEDGFDGTYFGVKATYYKYSFDRISMPTGATSEGTGTDKFKTLTFIWGSQIAKENIIYESFLGVGLNFMTRERYAYNNTQGGLNEGTVTFSGSPVAIELGFRVGFQL